MPKQFLQTGFARKVADHDFKFAKFDGAFHVKAVKCERLRRDVKRNHPVPDEFKADFHLG